MPGILPPFRTCFRRLPRRPPVWAGLAATAALAAALAGCGSAPTPGPTNPGGSLAFISATPDLALPTGIANSPYGFGFQTNVGEGGVVAIPPITFSLYPGGTLPPGMTFSSEGILSGSPSQAGDYNVLLQATDTSNPPITAEGNYTFGVRLPGTQMTLVGHSALGGHGQNGDVVVATATATGKSYAYIGTRGNAGECPATGVKIVDLSQPADPTVVGTIGGVLGASQTPPRIVTQVSSPSFHFGSSGDLLAVPLQPCDPNNKTTSQAGVQFYDVSDPTHPISLGFWASGVDGVGDVAFLPEPGPSVDGVVNHSQDRIYALVAVPGSETQNGAEGPPYPQGDLRVLDVTDPSLPQQIGQWGVLQTLDVSLPNVVLGYDPAVFLSSISLSQDRNTAFLAYWDEGVIVMNVSNPANITSGNSNIVLSQITYPATATATTTTPAEPEGNTFKALPVVNDTDLLVTDMICAGEQMNPVTQAISAANQSVPLVCNTPNNVNNVPLSPNQGWGYLRTYTLPSLAQPDTESFAITPQSMSDPAPDNGVYTAAGLAWNGNLQAPHAYVAWYSNGIVDVNLASVNPPGILASWTPPDSPDPNGTNLAVDNPPKAMIDGVAAYNTGGQPYVLGSDINSGLWIVKETPAPALAILTTSLPAGTLGIPYAASLSAASGALGLGEVSWGTTGNYPLPAGLTLDSNGNITGIPLTTGTSPVTFTADDGVGDSTSQTISMVVNSNFALAPLAPQVLTVNEPYSVQMAEANGTTPLTFSIGSGSLPSGVLLTPSTGVIAGTPTGLGTTNVTIDATDSSTPPLNTSLPLTLEVEPLNFQTTSLADGTVGTSYQQQVNLTNGTGPFNPVLTTGTLPPGLTLANGVTEFSVEGQADTGFLIYGTPTASGTYTFSVEVTDEYGNLAQQEFTLTVDPFEVSPTFLPAAEVGHGYAVALNLQGGTSPYTFALIGGTLPQGLQLSSTGNLSGIPAAASAGNYPITVQIIDYNGVEVQQSFNLEVLTGDTFAITTTGVQPAAVGEAYTASIAADFGTPPYTYSLFAGALPAGMSFTPQGILTGVPAPGTIGKFPFLIRATDNAGNAAVAAFTLVVQP